jgi:RND family efflux transporter MFP subunit
MKRYMFLLWLLISTLIMIGCTAEAQPEPVDNSVAIRVDQSIIETVENHYVTIGEVVPKSRVDVVLTQMGVIDQIFISPGDYVEVDSPLMALENDMAASNLDTTESQLRTIRDNLAVSYNSALDNYNKQKILYESGATSKSQLDGAYDQLITIQRQYADARNSYNNQVSNLQDSVDDLTIKSPISGQIASVYVTEGQSASNQLAVSIIENDELFVKTMISSDLKRKIDINDQVVIKTEMETVLSGTIANINKIPDPQSKLYEVRILLDDKESLLVGDYTEVVFTTESYEAVLVPSQAVVRKGIQQFVWVYENDVIEKRIVELGLSKDEYIEIKNTDQNFTLVISGQNNLSPNDTVKVVE